MTSVADKMSGTDGSSKALILITKNVISKIIDITSSLLVASDIFGPFLHPFISLIISMIKLKLMELWIDLHALDQNNVNVPDQRNQVGDQDNDQDRNQGGGGHDGAPGEVNHVNDHDSNHSGNHGVNGDGPREVNFGGFGRPFSGEGPRLLTSGVPKVSDSELKRLTSYTEKETEEEASADIITRQELLKQAETVRRLEQTLETMKL